MMQYLSRDKSEQVKMNNVKSWITSWIQANGLNTITREVKFRLDVKHVEY